MSEQERIKKLIEEEIAFCDMKIEDYQRLSASQKEIDEIVSILEHEEVKVSEIRQIVYVFPELIEYVDLLDIANSIINKILRNDLESINKQEVYKILKAAGLNGGEPELFKDQEKLKRLLVKAHQKIFSKLHDEIIEKQKTRYSNGKLVYDTQITHYQEIRKKFQNYLKIFNKDNGNLSVDDLTYVKELLEWIVTFDDKELLEIVKKVFDKFQNEREELFSKLRTILQNFQDVEKIDLDFDDINDCIQNDCVEWGIILAFIDKGLKKDFNQMSKEEQDTFISKARMIIDLYDKYQKVQNDLLIVKEKIIHEYTYVNDLLNDIMKRSHLFDDPNSVCKDIRILMNNYQSLLMIVNGNIENHGMNTAYALEYNTLYQDFERIKSDYGTIITDFIKREKEIGKMNLVFSYNDNEFANEEFQKGYWEAIKAMSTILISVLRQRSGKEGLSEIKVSTQTRKKKPFHEVYPKALFHPYRQTGNNKYRTGVIQFDVCEENKKKLMKRYNLDKSAAIFMTFGTIFVPGDDHDDYKNFEDFLLQKYNELQNMAEMFLDPQIDENILFRIIDEGLIRRDRGLISSSVVKNKNQK